jgi:hypothetical protein
MTSLSNEQVRVAEAVIRRLDGHTRSLAFYVDFALINYREPNRDMPLAEAAKEYLALREADHQQGNLSHRQFTAFRCELRALEIVFPGKTVAELTATALAEYSKRAWDSAWHWPAAFSSCPAANSGWSPTLTPRASGWSSSCRLPWTWNKDWLLMAATKGQRPTDAAEASRRDNGIRCGLGCTTRRDVKTVSPNCVHIAAATEFSK